KMVQEFDLRWIDFFKRRGVKPLRLVYEDFVEAYEATVQGVLRYIGVPVDGVAIVAPQLERQADPRSQEWAQRYLEGLARRQNAGSTGIIAACLDGSRTAASDVSLPSATHGQSGGLDDPEPAPDRRDLEWWGGVGRARGYLSERRRAAALRPEPFRLRHPDLPRRVSLPYAARLQPACPRASQQPQGWHLAA